MRLRPRSIRVRDTLIATLLSLIALTVVGVCVNLLVTSYVRHSLLSDIQRTADRVSTAVRTGTLLHPIREDSRVYLIQVVDAQGRVRDATEPAAGLGPLSRVRPPFPGPPQVVTECYENGRPCLEVAVVRVGSAADSPVVFAARELPWAASGFKLEYTIAGLVAALATAVAFATWTMVGRTLGPIEGVRAQLAEISMSDLSRRVPQPHGEDEIARMARTANETLERLEKSVERQRRFAADAAHELRTPIASLRVTPEDAAMYPGDIDLREMVDTALQSTERLESIVSDLLLLARLGTAGELMKPLDLAELVAEQVSARNQIEIRTALAAGVIVYGTADRLNRLLENLLDNAEKHANSVIDIEVGIEDGKAVLAVTDDGRGIPVADRERVFERFTRLDTARSRDAGGTGLGLAIARDIALSHGGTLNIENSPRGARFVLRIPLRAAG